MKGRPRPDRNKINGTVWDTVNDEGNIRKTKTQIEAVVEHIAIDLSITLKSQ